MAWCALKMPAIPVGYKYTSSSKMCRPRCYEDFAGEGGAASFKLPVLPLMRLRNAIFAWLAKFKSRKCPHFCSMKELNFASMLWFCDKELERMDAEIESDLRGSSAPGAPQDSARCRLIRELFPDDLSTSLSCAV